MRSLGLRVLCCDLQVYNLISGPLPVRSSPDFLVASSRIRRPINVEPSHPSWFPASTGLCPVFDLERSAAQSIPDDWRRKQGACPEPDRPCLARLRGPPGIHLTWLPSCYKTIFPQAQQIIHLPATFATLSVGLYSVFQWHRLV